MNRISRKTLEARVDTINHLLNLPATSWTRNGDSLKANIGNMHIASNSPGDRYGTRYSLEQMVTDGGGVRVVLSACGSQDFYDVLSAFIAGIYIVQQQDEAAA